MLTTVGLKSGTVGRFGQGALMEVIQRSLLNVFAEAGAPFRISTAEFCGKLLDTCIDGFPITTLLRTMLPRRATHTVDLPCYARGFSFISNVSMTSSTWMSL